MRRLVIFLVVLLIGIGAYFVLREDGLLEQVTEQRVEAALLANGVPENLAACMAPRMTDRLSISQLLKLERLAPEEGEERLPRGPGDALERLRRVDDDEAVRVLAETGAACGLEAARDAVEEQLQSILP